MTSPPPRFRSSCFQCGERGHLSRDCQSEPTAAGEDALRVYRESQRAAPQAHLVSQPPPSPAPIMFSSQHQVSQFHLQQQQQLQQHQQLQVLQLQQQQHQEQLSSSAFFTQLAPPPSPPAVFPAFSAQHPPASLAQSPPAHLAANSALARGPPLCYTILPPASVVGYDSRASAHGPSVPPGPRAFMGHCSAVSPLATRSAPSMTAGLFAVPPSVASVGAVPGAVFSASSVGAVPPSPWTRAPVYYLSRCPPGVGSVGAAPSQGRVHRVSPSVLLPCSVGVDLHYFFFLASCPLPRSCLRSGVGVSVVSKT